MDGVFKVIVLSLCMFFLSCSKSDNTISEGKDLIAKNINILIDSVRSFNMTGILKDSKSGKLIKDSISIGLIDSVKIDEKILNSKINISDYVKLKLSPTEIVNFKSEYNYKLSLVPVNNFDIKIVFVSFKNLKIYGDFASVEVKKVRGIGMTHDIYYFEKIDNEWVFKRKELLGIG